MTTVARGPYVGPRPFAAAARQRFFGRQTETLAVFERWSSEPVTVLYGPSGSGKTSLVQAALVPMAAASGARDRIVLDGWIAPTTAAPPAQRFPMDLNPFAWSLLTSWSRAEPAEGQALPPIEDFLGGLPAAGQLPIFAVIDRFEWLFRDDSQAQRHRSGLLDQLVGAVAQVPNLHLLLSVREEFLPELGELEARLGRIEAYRLGPLGPGAALEAVVGPLRGHHRSFAPGAAEEVVRNLRSSRFVDALGGSRDVLADTVEPAQVQVVCSWLWTALPADVEVIALTDLYAPADLDGGLVRFCERTVHDVAAANELSGRELSAWLARTFVTDRGTRGTVYEGVADVAGMPRDVAGQLCDRHILSAEFRHGSRWYQLPNDRLIAAVLESADQHGTVGTARTIGTAAGAAGGDPASSLAAAQDALAAGDLGLAAQRATEAVRTSGGHDVSTRATALSCLGRVAAEGGHVHQAESYYGRGAALFEAVQDQAGSGRLLAELGRVLLGRGQYSEAVATLQGAEARLPGDLTIQIDLARALRDCGQLWAATAVLGAALTVAPGTVEALVERGLIRITTGEFASALDDLDNAVRLRPSVGQQADVRSARELARARLTEPT